PRAQHPDPARRPRACSAPHPVPLPARAAGLPGRDQCAPLRAGDARRALASRRRPDRVRLRIGVRPRFRIAASMATDPKALIQQLLRTALQEKAPEVSEKLPIVLERPKQANHGDFSSSVALQAAKPTKLKPSELAKALKASVEAQVSASASLRDMFEKVEVAGPGFINFKLKAGTKTAVIRRILEEGASFGRTREGRGEKVQVEFVSANPTGPLHVGHGRQAALGDAIAALLESQGYAVTREFYYNDAGAQIENLALSVQARGRGIAPGAPGWPGDGYNGEYIQEIASDFVQQNGEL